MNTIFPIINFCLLGILDNKIGNPTMVNITLTPPIAFCFIISSVLLLIIKTEEGHKKLKNFSLVFILFGIGCAMLIFGFLNILILYILVVLGYLEWLFCNNLLLFFIRIFTKKEENKKIVNFIKKITAILIILCNSYFILFLTS